MSIALPVPEYATSNLRLVGYSDQGGRCDGVQIMVQNGYAYVGHIFSKGFSVIDVIDTVKRVSGTEFAVEFGARRPGDPARIVAASDRIRATLGWRPQFDDLTTIARDALAWELQLTARRDRGPMPAAASA